MTDEEIIKALECCQNGGNVCGVCPLRYKWNIADECIDYLAQNALDLIKTQKTVIEGWKDAFNNLDKMARPSLEYVEDEKAKAIKAFAEKLKEKALIVEIADYEYGVLVDDIDELVKEMTEVKDNDT